MSARRGRYVTCRLYMYSGPLPTRSTTGRRRSPQVLSSNEAEYVSLSEAAREATWLRWLLQDLRLLGDEPVLIFVDNKGAIDITRVSGITKLSKHIDTPRLPENTNFEVKYELLFNNLDQQKREREICGNIVIMMLEFLLKDE